MSATLWAKFFFERLDGVGILFVGLWTGAHMRETQVLQSAIDRVVRHRERKLLVQPHDQIARPPAHHAVDCRNRPLRHDPREKSLVGVVKLGWNARRRDIDETVWPLLVEADHPVPQRLAIHPANRRRAFPRGPIEHRRNRQKPARLRGILGTLRKLPNLASRIVRPNRNGLAHGKLPPFAILNHPAADSRTRRVSQSADWYYAPDRMI
jgi:hypothetical protein